ncbi:chromosome segregation protein SMC [Aureispira anguillae]|uniref:Chromosome partition protein Smc n=1 Tax=Aureispira anguillae TaxID=2864201 RepID=A0A916DRL1_9BACT|nr:chromosome segregation protein SMC [Aureispira anguillae]BDS11919.1 chromosome segregation protein SMC [Aureispira anguillae]
MRLKSLEIKGFKSFADRTVINFGEDVIGIVGSNGCGKSNIVDAIRWVLGEQKTSQLRSESMTSVIFNGTKGRKASGLAEVTLTFINDKGILPLEYQEVSIKRILYKDGSSEYQLNGVKCRLKDISNLLVDTGMGSDSYAIIALGMVDDLLQDKDNSRLKLFEQAAGISKYKIRKKETFNKLKATEADLSRVEDLLFEIQKNLKSLERQAKRAKRYFELKDEYRRLSLELSYFKIAECKKNYKELDVQLEVERKAKKELDLSIETLEKRVERGRTGNLEKEQELASSQKKLNSLVGKIKGKENDKKILAQKTLFLQQNNEKLDERIASNRKRIAETEKNIELQSEQLDEEYKKGKALSLQLEEAKAILEKIRGQHGSTKRELEEFVIQQKVLNNSAFEQEKRAAILQNQEESALRNIERLNQNLEQRTVEVKGITEQASQLEAAQKEQEEVIDKMKIEEEVRKKNLEKTELELETAKENLSLKNRKLDAKRNEYKLLKSLVENMDGFSESIKFLNKNQSWSDNAPLLSDIFYCEPTYRAAVENYLEAYLSYYVVQNFTEALQAIELLDQNQKGKANFFLLDQFPEQDAPSNTSNKGVWALDVLTYDARYQALAEYLLGNVYIVEEKVGVEELDSRTIWLTQDGKFTQRGYSVRGGSVGAFEGKKIGRKKNLELLETQIEALSEEAQIMDNLVKDLRLAQQNLRQANQQFEIQKLEKQLNNTVRQAITIKSKLDSFELFRKETEDQKATYHKQITAHQQEQKMVQSQLTRLQKELLELKTTVSEKDASVQDIAQGMAEASSNYNKKHIEQVRHQNGMASIEKELDFCHRQYKELKDQRKRDEEILNESGGDLVATQKEIEVASQQLHEWYEVKKEYQEAVVVAEKAYFKARSDMSDTEKELREKQRKQTQQLELLGKLDNKFNEVKMQLTSIAERLNMEFEIKINDLVNETPNPEFEEAVLESNVAQLRGRLTNYGPINPMAIEAYDEIQDRNKLIVEQRDDLIKSKENLMATISEIESKATERFMAAFNQARTYFIQVFRSLFHEDDTCDLKLTAPETPLESKIEIVAKPKGKRPLSINQLSGGEKTLTATALLFSLYLLKPAPFCIFDEVDAPLDDANIAKFNNIVKDFSKNSQFVIVTHNKKTMEAVDIMYGVTMVKGISRVVPVDFREMETVT